MSFTQIHGPQVSNNLARELISGDDTPGLVSALWSFRELQIDIATHLIVQKHGFDVATYIESFHPDSHIAIAHMLINSGEVTSLLSFIDEFQGLHHVEVADRILESGKGSLLVPQISLLTGLSIEDKVRIVDRLVQEGWGPELADDSIAPGFEDIETTLVDLGNRGTGTPMRAFIARYSYMDTDEPNAPVLRVGTKLEIDAGCVSFSGETPEETVKAIKANMSQPNRPEQWRGLSEPEFIHHEADVIEACHIALIRTTALSR